MVKDEKSSVVPMGQSLRTVVLLWRQGILDFYESFYTCITADLVLFLSSITPISVSLLLIPLALNVISSLICSVYGAGVGGSDCWVEAPNETAYTRWSCHSGL